MMDTDVTVDRVSSLEKKSKGIFLPIDPILSDQKGELEPKA